MTKEKTHSNSHIHANKRPSLGGLAEVKLAQPGKQDGINTC